MVVITDSGNSLLFTGLLINRKSVPAMFQWLHTVSFFHAAFEALAVNELRYLQLHEEKYGVNIDVPAAAILSMFGLRAEVRLLFPFRTVVPVKRG